MRLISKSAGLSCPLSVVRRYLERKCLSIGLTFVLLAILVFAGSCTPPVKRSISEEPVGEVPLQETPAQEPAESSLKYPELDLRVIDSFYWNGLNVEIKATVTNPNPVVIGLGDLRVQAQTEAGIVYVRETITAGSIEANSSRTFARSILLPPAVLVEKKVIIALNGRAVAAGTTLPFDAAVAVEVPKISPEFTRQAISVRGSTGALSPGGLNTTLEATIQAPGSHRLSVGITQIIVRGSRGNEYVRTNMIGGSVAPDSSGTFTSEFIMPLEVLNERDVTIDTESLIQIGTTSQSLKGSTRMQIPRLYTLITAPKMTVENYSIRWNTKTPGSYDPNITAITGSFELTMYVTIANESEFNLYSDYLQVLISSPALAEPKSARFNAGALPANSAKTFSGTFYVENVVFGADAVIKVSIAASLGKLNELIPVSASITFPLK